MIPAAVIGSSLALALLWKSGPSNTTKVQSEVDGREYTVQNLPDKEEAANRMATIRANLVKLYTYYKSDEGLLADPPVKRFVDRFSPEVFTENDMGSDSTAYSDNKGDSIVICLRDKTQPPKFPLVPENTVMFVVLHEMAHLMTESIGHTPEFWGNFRRILQDSVQLGIYHQENYSKTPVPYCGMMITDSPL
jgi:hypothetical protein